METPQYNPLSDNSDFGREIDELMKWTAETSRQLKAALRNHDPEALAATREKISTKMGEDFADSAIALMITRMMSAEDWSFFDEEGNPSPLL